MSHDKETILRYLAACGYALRTIGSDAEKYFDRLHKLAAVNSKPELESIIRGWRAVADAQSLNDADTRDKSDKSDNSNKSDKPDNTVASGPCRYYGGTRLCPRCIQEQTPAGVGYAGAMILAQQIFEDHRKFVLSRIHADALPWTGGKTYPSFDDLEQEVWQAVARRIGEYIDQETPLAWLKVITHATVIDHFRRTWAKKRGTNVTRPLDFDPVNPNSPVLPPAKPTYASDEDDPDPAHERSETVGRKMKR